MIQVFNNTNTLNKKAAEFFIEKAQEAIKKRNKFTVALTGGSSPNGLYQLLASSPYKEEIDWSKVFVFWGDERWVPIDDEKSNAGAAYKSFLNHILVPESNIFPMWKKNVEPEAYALAYEKLLEKHLEDGEVFDLILLGMGDDGHTASLFPGEEILKEENKKVDAYFLAPQDMYRITLTAPLINKARKIVFLVFGEKKANALYQVVQGERNSNLYPAQLIHPEAGKVIWMVDEKASNRLKLK
ncbi:6-phosphogluconolactonase [Galbibacter sp. EGI 63066]|uniref:6-phosphogluconolactonase n=1 Tax=Galbibacter sp. EGI 63066 TaxID=2993559 RepID=UPI0022488609|nr:6-phosphogluconolactonase [Galbibacter sp. EGI 63066]MCX2679130.1 6-phosphogluconolactonase [Galbibacter sp. EGI 63066]